MVLSAEMSEGIDAVQLGRMEEGMVRVRGRFRERLVAVKEATEVERIFIFDAEARILVDTEEDAMFGAPLYRVEADRREWEQAFEEGRSYSAAVFEDQQRGYYKTAYVPILLEGEAVAMIGVVAGATYFDLLTSFATVLTLLGALGVMGVALVGLWLSARLAGPVRRLVEAAERLAAGELKTPVDQNESLETEELAFLTGAFEEMRQSIVERDQQMQMMLAGIAHEIRNPLGGMELFCGLLREELEEAAREQQVEMVRKIERELGYLDRVVDDFLTFSSPHQVGLIRCEGEGFIEEIREVVESELKRSGCQLVVDVEPGVELIADPVRLRRAVINLVQNACQASRPGAKIKLRLVAGGRGRRIEVIDEGAGIEEELLREIEKPFFTTREKGSGLGLSLTRGIAEEHGGALEIESRPGVGTTVRLEIPFEESRCRRQEEKQEREADPIPEGWLG